MAVENLKRCKLLVLDVDGVLTDGTKLYDREGAVIGKRFNDRDFTAIQRFRSAGVQVCFLTADLKVTEAIAAKRKIDVWHARRPDGSVDKIRFLPELEARYGVSRDEIVFVGDDLGDAVLMRELSTCFCPSTAPRIVQETAHVLTRCGGDGLIAELYDIHEAL